jgi:DNA-binding Lrp family transcriptional regulator
MRKKLDLLDVKILEGLGKYYPRNIAEVAKKLNMPRGTLFSRIKTLSSYFYLRLVTNVYITKLGLKKGIVFAKATPGYEDLLFNCMKVNKFYTYLSRCYSSFEGCFGMYGIPKDHTKKFEQFIQEIKRLGVAYEVQILWSTCFYTVNRTSNWFDSSSETWTFPWDKWVEEIQAEGTELPYTLVDPKDFPIEADETDLFIIKELEKDATISLTAVANKLGTTLQNVSYHYNLHVIKNGLLENFQVFIFPFDRTISNMFFFTFKFENIEKMVKFALSLLDKPFVYILGKVLGENTITAQVYLPRSEFRNFIDNLLKLIRAGFLQSYNYVIQDLRLGKWSRETIPYESFKNGSWIYDHSEHIRSLHDLVNKSAQHEVKAVQ